MALRILPVKSRFHHGNPLAKEWEIEPQPETIEQIKERIASAGRDCWDSLFRSVSTENDLLNWEKTIPRYGCDCESFYLAFKKENPPSFPLSFEWKWELKSAVNKKLGKINLSLDEAQELYAQPPGR